MTFSVIVKTSFPAIDGCRLKVPGMGNGKMVMLFKPEDIQTMYSSDGRIPMLPGFDNFEYSRNVSMKDRFPSAGLISNKVKKFVYSKNIFLSAGH